MFRQWHRWAGFGMLLCGGCLSNQTAESTASGWSREAIENASYVDAFGAARHAAGQWFVVSESRPETGRIQTAWVEADQRGDTGRMRDVMGGKNRVRRQATLRVVEQPKEHRVLIECVVIRQRLDTQDARAMSQRNSLDESPNRTPIHGEAGVSREQSEVWTDIGRDRGMERQILDIARDRLRRTEPVTSAPARG